MLYVERGGRTLLSWTEDPEPLQAAADALALAVHDGALGRLTVERADGADVLGRDSRWPGPWSGRASTRRRAGCACGVACLIRAAHARG